MRSPRSDGLNDAAVPVYPGAVSAIGADDEVSQNDCSQCPCELRYRDDPQARVSRDSLLAHSYNSAHVYIVAHKSVGVCIVLFDCNNSGWTILTDGFSETIFVSF